MPSAAHFRATEYIYILWEQSGTTAIVGDKMRTTQRPWPYPHAARTCVQSKNVQLIIMTARRMMVGADFWLVREYGAIQLSVFSGLKDPLL